ncbi:MAG: ureidoglycolate lyase [Rhodospirillales bacterium]|nr:MAG: ureidoglycolate lyase [Rhodospirillales bacterium]
MADAPRYLFEAAEKPSLPLVEVPLIEATEASLAGYGCLVDDPETLEVEIVRWPAHGWRPVDEDSGDEGGIAEGIFHGEWDGDVLKGRNEAVGGEYVLGFARDPQHARTGRAGGPRERVLLWHMNYHPDGGQLFFPLDRTPFVVPLALPGDDLAPDKVVAFWCDGARGLYIHPDIWHEGVFPVADRQRFLDRQGRVHARISCDFGAEFGVYLSVPLRR